VESEHMDFRVQNQNRSSFVPHHPPEVATIGKSTRKYQTDLARQREKRWEGHTAVSGLSLLWYLEVNGRARGREKQKKHGKQG